MFILLQLIILLLSFFVSKAQEETASSILSNGHDEDYINLDELSDAELEEICTQRGFDLVKEKNADGEEIAYTHEDYMDAASQCLAIEAEMEKVLKEHPEILDELKEEAEKIRAEKDQLEAELALARENAAKQKEEDRKPFVGGTSDGAAAAAAAVEGDDENKKESSAPTEKEVFADADADAGGVDTDNNAKINTTAKPEEVEEEKKSESTANETKGEDETKVVQDEIIDVNEEQQDTGEILDLDKEQESEESTTTTTTELPSDKTDEVHDNNRTIPSSLADLTKETFIEMKVQMQRDLKMLMDIIFPKHLRGPVKTALQPVVRITKGAGNSVLGMLKRYLVAILDKKEDGQQVAAVN